MSNLNLNKQAGFSLVELLIALTILLVIAAIAIPNLIRSKIAANESSAAASLRTINTAEAAYNNAYHTYAALSSLGGNCSGAVASTSSSACLLDSLLSGGAKSGYTFVVTPAGTSYTATATPQAQNTGIRQFCTDTNMVIYYAVASSGCTIGTKPL